METDRLPSEQRVSPSGFDIAPQRNRTTKTTLTTTRTASRQICGSAPQPSVTATTMATDQAACSGTQTAPSRAAPMTPTVLAATRAMRASRNDASSGMADATIAACSSDRVVLLGLVAARNAATRGIKAGAGAVTHPASDDVGASSHHPGR